MCMYFLYHKCLRVFIVYCMQGEIRKDNIRHLKLCNPLTSDENQVDLSFCPVHLHVLELPSWGLGGFCTLY